MANAQSSNVMDFLGRTFNVNEGNLSPQTARDIIKFKLDKRDRQRMHKLASKNQSDEGLTWVEQEELRTYRTGVTMLAVLQAKARLSLKKAK